MTEPKVMIVGDGEAAERTHDILKNRSPHPLIVGMMGLAAVDIQK